jgi:hypothetical protein
MDERHSIFRDRAITYYMQQQEQDVPIHIVAPPPSAIFLWMLCGFLLIAGLAGWWGKIPFYLVQSGVLLTKESRVISSTNETMVFILMPTSSFTLRLGMPIQLQFRSTKGSIESKIETVEPLTYTTGALHQWYGLACNPSSLSTRPSVIIAARIETTLVQRASAGESVDVQIRVGSQRILSLLPGIGALIGGE